MNRSIWICLAVFFLLLSNARADYFLSQEAVNHQLAIAQLAQAKDEMVVTLTGTIVRQVKHEHYELQDSTGKIMVEIDEKLATQEQLKSGTQIRIVGEVDTHRHKPMDIDVIRIELLS